MKDETWIEDPQLCPYCETLVSMYIPGQDRFMRLHIDNECEKVPEESDG